MPSSEAMPGYQLQLSRIAPTRHAPLTWAPCSLFLLPSSFSFIKPTCPGQLPKRVYLAAPVASWEPLHGFFLM